MTEEKTKIFIVLMTAKTRDGNQFKANSGIVFAKNSKDALEMAAAEANKRFKGCEIYIPRIDVVPEDVMENLGDLVKKYYKEE